MAEKKKAAPSAAPSPAGDKKKALETAIAQIEKNYGKGAIMRLGDDIPVNVEAISTGSLSLDLALGIGGEPGLEVDTFGLELLLMSLECLPSGSRRSIDRCGNSCHRVLLSIRAHASMRPDIQMPLF